MRCADQDSLQIRENDHEVRPGSAPWSFGGQSLPFVFFQWNGVSLKNAYIAFTHTIVKYSNLLHVYIMYIKLGVLFSTIIEDEQNIVNND